MLKKRGFIFTGIAAVMAAGVLAGCSGSAGGGGTTSTKTDDTVTAESLAATASEKLKDVDSYTFDYDMDMDYSMSAEGTSMEMKMDVDMDGEAISKTNEVHMTMNMNQSGLGMEMSAKNEGYITLADDGTLTSYSKTVSDGEDSGWVKSVTSTGIDLEKLKNIDIYKKIADGEISAQLSETSEKVNGKDVYKLDLTLPGEYFEQVFAGAFASADQSISSMSGMDFSEISADTEIYIYKDSGLPAKLYMDAAEYGDKLIEQMMSASGGLPEGMEMKFDAFNVEQIMDNYNTIDKIEIPAEVINEAKSAETTDATDAAETTETTASAS